MAAAAPDASPWDLPADALVKQGAEARVYVLPLLGRRALVKERFAKRYRHPQLDAAISAQRTRAEVRSLQRCRSLGLDAPVVWLVDRTRNRIWMEFVDGVSLRDRLRASDAVAALEAGGGAPVDALAARLGEAVGRLHDGDVIHGDLTSSNVLLRASGSLVLIDFGLSFVSTLAEDKAVDLYVLERALLSTHAHSEAMFQRFAEAYARSKGGAAVLSRLDEVRARGRKRDMSG